MGTLPAKTFDQGKDEVTKLCRYFTTNRQAFLAPGVKEAHVRQSLIDPFFEALGWDVGNKAMTAPQYREVVPEDSLDVEGQQKAPDYTFRVGSLPKFYAEAKKCGVNIGADPAPAFQLRRYGWSAKLALSILTDFEELGVYDCTLRPHPSEKASRARIQHFHFEEYPDRWRELWDVFSREAVWSGAFDQYAASKRKRGTSEVDVEFLKEMEGWRLALAGNMALRNKGLSLDDLNAAVQLTIDRVVFLRMAEDRGLEPYEQLLKLCERADIYSRFMRDLCRRADQKYNSGLFHFQNEGSVSEEPDRITPKLVVDDRVFKPILQSLYFAHGSPYHFGVMPVEILGTVYERFLGKVIRLTAGHQAKIEEKPEVRKARGVYYTPASIVDYIVRQTVAPQIERRSPAQLASSQNKAPFRVLDMACGSGSFLLGAYQCFLDHCLSWYNEHKPENYKKAVYKDPRSGYWRLTIEERKRILTTHLFGVDIDPQAVEVTKLSLLLKVLEGETDQSLSLSQLAFGDRALPNLADNIKCGNSLIGPDYFMGKLIVDSEEMKHVNPFDWKQRFPDAMKAGGFDCVIGNPPWVFTREGDFAATMKKYLDDVYLKGLVGSQTGRAKQSGKINLFAIFILKSTRLLKERGQFGYIVPNTLLRATVYDVIRKHILDSTTVRMIADLGSGVFERVTASTVILVLEKGEALSTHFVNVAQGVKAASPKTTVRISQASFLDNTSFAFSLYGSASSDAVTEKMTTKSVRLGQICTIHAGGIATGPGKSSYISDRKLSSTYKPLIEGKDIDRYLVTFRDRFILYDRKKLYRARDEEIFLAQEKLVTQRIAGGERALVVGYDDQQFYTFNSTNTILRDSTKNQYSLKYILGLLNSRLLNWYYILSYTNRSQLTVNISKTFLEQLPIRRIDSSVGVEKALHDRIVRLVDSMLALRKHHTTAKSSTQKAIMQRQIDATDAEIDRLVYDLYDLTAAEIALIESPTSGAKAPMTGVGR